MCTDVGTEDVLAENVSLELLALSVITNITGNAVGNINSSINASLEGGEDLRTSAGALETSVQHSVEGAGSVSEGLNVVVLTVDLGLALVFVSKTELGKGSAGKQQTGCVSCKSISTCTHRQSKASYIPAA